MIDSTCVIFVEYDIELSRLIEQFTVYYEGKIG